MQASNILSEWKKGIAQTIEFDDIILHVRALHFCISHFLLFAQRIELNRIEHTRNSFDVQYTKYLIEAPFIRIWNL